MSNVAITTTNTTFTGVRLKLNEVIGVVNQIGENEHVAAGNSYLTSTYVSNSTFQAFVANTNAYIAATSGTGEVSNAAFQYFISNTNLANVSSNIVPSANVTYDLGTANNSWRSLYLSGNTIYLGDAQISASGSKVLFNSIPAVSNSHLSATFTTNAAFQSALANTNSYIASESARIDLINTNLTGTNTAIRTLISDRMQVANVTSAYVTNTVFQLALANTNAYIASVSGGGGGGSGDVANSYLTSTFTTNAAFQSALSNTNSYIAAESARIDLINTNLTSTNTAIRTLASDRLQVANAATIYQTKTTELAHLANTNSFIKSQLANTNASIDTQASRITLVNTNLTGTNTALRTLISDRLQVANAAATYQTKVIERAALANTNLRINLVNTNLTGTNTSLRTLISDRLQVANAAATYQTKVIERAALANTNAYIAAQASRITLVNTNLTGTNTAIRTLVSDRLQVANATTLFATKASWTALTGTNTALRTLISDRLQVANAVATYQTKTIERAALANTNLRINLINTNLTGTNTAIRTLVSDRYQVANVNTLLAAKATWAGLIATNTAIRALDAQKLQVANATTLLLAKASWTGLTTTNTALRTLISDRLQVANAASIYQTKAVERAALANTNSYIAAQATRITLVNTNLTGTNTALRTLISDRLQVANAVATYQTKAIERAALANTNASIATQTSRITLVNTNLTGTNTALRTLISDRLQVANAATIYQTKTIERAALANTNAYIASVSSTERSALANTNAYIATKADIASPTFTGTPAAPTAAAGTNTTQLATTAFVRTEVTNLVDSAPSTLDTLNELAAALSDNPNFATTLTTNLGQKLGATASVTLTGDVTGSASFSSNAVSISTTDTNLGNTNSYISSESARINLINTNLTSTNTAIRTLVSDRMQVANVTSAYVTNSVFQSSLSNTNAYIATKLDTSSYTEADVRSKAALANTNAYIASVQSDVDANEATERAALANTNAYIATKVNTSTFNLALANTNAYIASVSSTERAALANTNAYIATKVNTSTFNSALANTNAYIASVQSDVDSNEATERAALANTNAYIATMLPKAGGQMSGNITFAGSQTVDGRDLSVDGAKLDGIESGATADQTAADIRGLGFFDTSNDGSGSGLDADTVDGIQGAAIWRKGTDIPTAADLNDYTTDGYYHQNANANAAAGTNYPVALAGMLEVTSDGAMVYQRYTAYSSTHIVYVRTYYSTTWYSWATQWSSLNDGTGSGLDADLWDGNQFASYLNQAVLTSSSPTFAGLTIDTNTLYVDATNNRVGIGTSSPSEALTVIGNGVFGDVTTKYNRITINGGHVGDGDNDYGLTINSFEPAITLLDRSTDAGSSQIYGLNNGGILLRGDTTNDGTIGHTANITDFDIARFEPTVVRLFTDNTERMRIDSAGDVGIGTAAPGYKLDVVGDINSSGTVSATNFDNVSDISLKENIESISASKDIIDNLNPVSFNWKDTGEKSFGFIAQEVENILPEIVHTKADGAKTVSYIQLIPFLIQIIKEQQQQINIINNKLNNA
jgi:hypothetical protein